MRDRLTLPNEIRLTLARSTQALTIIRFTCQAPRLTGVKSVKAAALNLGNVVNCRDSAVDSVND